MDITKSNERKLPPFNGEAVDPRSEEQKSKDYPHEDFLGGSSAPLWREKTQDEWVKIGKREQLNSSSCGGQAGAKAISFLVNEIASAILYRMRNNYPQEGMYMQDIGNILVKLGTGSEELYKSQYLTEPEMNALKEYQDLPFKIGSYYFLPSYQDTNADTIAKALDQGHPVIFLVRWNNDEWVHGVPVDDGTPIREKAYGHFVTSVPSNYLMYNGEKAFVIDDSTGNWCTINDAGQRILTEDWLKTHCVGIMALKPVVKEEKPKLQHTFNVNLVYGAGGIKHPEQIEEVKWLQRALIDQGCLKEGLDTGYFGTLTMRAVIQFQEKYFNEVLKPVGLSQGNGKVLTYTRKQLNALYS